MVVINQDSPTTNYLSFPILRDIQSDLIKFAFQPVLVNIICRCFIRRERKDIDEKLFSPKYFMSLEKENGMGIFVLAARKRKRSKTSNYIISTDSSQLYKAAPAIVGKLRFVTLHYISYQFVVLKSVRGQIELSNYSHIYDKIGAIATVILLNFVYRVQM